MTGPWRLPARGLPGRWLGRVISSRGLALSLRDRRPVIDSTSPDRRGPGSGECPPVRFVRPSNAPSVRSTIRGILRGGSGLDDEGCRADASPEGVSHRSVSLFARVFHCPTADESVVVVWSTQVSNVPSRRKAGAAPTTRWVRRAPGFPRGFVVRSCARRLRPEGRRRRTWVRTSDRPKAIVRLAPPCVPEAAFRGTRHPARGLVFDVRGTPKGTAYISHHAGAVALPSRCLPVGSLPASVPPHGLRRSPESFCRPAQNRQVER